MRVIIIGVIFALMAIVATTIGAKAATVYTWNLADYHYGLVPRGTVSETIPPDTGDTMTLHPLYGRWILFQYNYHCNAEVCAEGVFHFSRNDVQTFSSGSGLNFSPDLILDYDPAPVNAYNMSSIVFEAQVAGFLEEPVVKGIIISTFGIFMGRMIFKAVFTLIGQTRNHFDQEGTEDTNSNTTAITLDDDKKDDGAE